MRKRERERERVSSWRTPSWRRQERNSEEILENLLECKKKLLWGTPRLQSSLVRGISHCWPKLLAMMMWSLKMFSSLSFFFPPQSSGRHKTYEDIATSALDGRRGRAGVSLDTRGLKICTSLSQAPRSIGSFQVYAFAFESNSRYLPITMRIKLTHSQWSACSLITRVKYFAIDGFILIVMTEFNSPD